MTVAKEVNTNAHKKHRLKYKYKYSQRCSLFTWKLGRNFLSSKIQVTDMIVDAYKNLMVFNAFLLLTNNAANASWVIQ